MACRLSYEDRVRLQVGWQSGLTFERLGELLGRPFGTVFREVQRNHSCRHGPKNPLGRSLPPSSRGLYRWGYDAGWAQRRADRRSRRPKPAKLKTPGLCRTVVLARLRLRWSPEQIAARMRRDFPDRPEMWVSPETIYQARATTPQRCSRGARGRVTGTSPPARPRPRIGPFPGTGKVTSSSAVTAVPR